MPADLPKLSAEQKARLDMFRRRWGRDYQGRKGEPGVRRARSRGRRASPQPGAPRLRAGPVDSANRTAGL